MRFRNQPIPEPFCEEELLIKEEEPEVPDAEMLTQVDPSPELH